MKKGEAKKGQGEKRETLKNKQTMPSLEGKTGFLRFKTKKGKEKKTIKKQIRRV